jgi:hypothetical protein
MDIFKTHRRIVNDYATYIRSFLRIADPAILAKVEDELDRGRLWPEPLLQFNPSFESFGSLDNIVNQGTLHRDLKEIFKGFSLYRHQVEAIRLGTEGKDFVVTSGSRFRNRLSTLRCRARPVARCLNQPSKSRASIFEGCLDSTRSF